MAERSESKKSNSIKLMKKPVKMSNFTGFSLFNQYALCLLGGFYNLFSILFILSSILLSLSSIVTILSSNCGGLSSILIKLAS